MSIRPSFLIRFVLVALVVGLSSEVKAGAIAYARDNITQIDLKTGIANNFTNNGVTTNAQDGASLDSGGMATDSQNLDPKVAAVGPNKGAAAENTFVLLGPHIAKADAVIANNLRSTQGDALVNLNKTDSGSATSSSTLRIDFTLAQADVITLSFTAAAFLQASLHANAQATSLAIARMTVDITITQQFGNFDTIFHWRPDGAGTIDGGATNNDPFDLNKELREVNAGGSQTYEKGPGGFSATSNQLAAGKYTLDFYMSQTAFAQDVKPTPEPTTLISALAGGFALVILTRRRSA